MDWLFFLKISRRQAARRFISCRVELTDDIIKYLCHMVLFKRFRLGFGKGRKETKPLKSKLLPSKTTHAMPVVAIAVVVRVDVPIGKGVEAIRVVATVNHRRPEVAVLSNVL